MNKLSIREVELKGKRVLIRVDFNVPMEYGLITDDTRIRAALPTIVHAVNQGARVVLASHLGRPNGRYKGELSLWAVAEKVGALLRKPIFFIDEYPGPKADRQLAKLRSGEIMLLENLRFYPGEEANEANFAEGLASFTDGIFVNDAFGAAHRAHASTLGVTRYVGQSVAGLLMQKELDFLGKAIADPEKPYVAVLGGAKVSGKMEVLSNLLPLVDKLIIGGGMAYTFLKAQGEPVGKSLVEEDKVELAAKLLKDAAARGVEVILPSDYVVAAGISDDAKTEVVGKGGIPDDQMSLDIGPATIEAFTDALDGARTIFWNGPMGVFEHTPFAAGTMAIARAIAHSRATSIAGGGDSVAAAAMAGVTQHISHISTGGGAALEFIGGRKLPGVEALTPAEHAEVKSRA